ncbi:ClpP/crotonase-like domain-containing protein [Gilbertella persicaria]|nr:ClpP/crotonase-like domain-containing protein [Gilbertella persicaria]KAI8059045.1 ClpP/crotonase-like domain-containing protein [Gilbertella persicaria]
MHESIDRLARLPLVTVAVVTGGAIGGGSELLVGFDFVCMSKQTGFVHFVQTRMGVSSPWGGMRRLLQIVGRKKALQWMAGGYRLEANACFEAGLVDILAETDQTSLAQTLLFLKPFLINSNRKVSYEAVRGMKKLVTRQDKTNDWHYENDVFSSTVFSKL